jgi:hypothetical protein
MLMVVTSAWWVPYSQVQRDDAGYEVRGKKNFLPPAMLVLGYGILWTTEDEETMERHARTLLVEPETPAEPSYEIEEEEAVDGDAPDDVKEEPTKDDSDSEDAESNDEGKDNSINRHDQDKYNLAEYGSASDPESVEPASQATQPQTKRYLSAKQRRDLKKGKQHEDQDSDSDVDEITSSITTLSVKSKPQPQVRGKKGKQKKIKSRYADQSDEERELARKLLGAKTETPEKLEEIKPVDNKPSPTKPIPKPRLPPKPSVDEPVEVFPQRWLM